MNINKISNSIPVRNNYNNNNIDFGGNALSSLKKISKPKNVMKGAVLGLMTLTAATCSNIRGGNFIYNEQEQKIEKFHKLDINDVECNITNKYGLYGCHDKEYIKSMGVDNWIKSNKDKLTGSCIFTKNKSLLSKTIRFFTTQVDAIKNEFVPSHAASIYKDENGNLKILQIEVPKVHVDDLADYLQNTNDDYVIFIRDFDVNEEKFSNTSKSHVGKKYGLVSAMQTVSSLINPDGGIHCSEEYVQQLQDEGMFKNIDANQITPHTLLYLLTNNHYNNLNKEITTF